MQEQDGRKRYYPQTMQLNLMRIRIPNFYLDIAYYTNIGYFV